MINSTAGKYHSEFANKKVAPWVPEVFFSRATRSLAGRRPKAEDTGGGSLSFRLQLTDTGNYA